MSLSPHSSGQSRTPRFWVRDSLIKMPADDDTGAALKPVASGASGGSGNLSQSWQNSGMLVTLEADVRSFARSVIACFPAFSADWQSGIPLSSPFSPLSLSHLTSERKDQKDIRPGPESCLPFRLHGSRLTHNRMAHSLLPTRRKVTPHREYPMRAPPGA